MRTAARSFVAALVGGGVMALVLVLGVGVGDSSGSTTRVIQPARPAAQLAAKGSSALTAHEIYRRAAPGVVFIRSQISGPSRSPLSPFPQPRRGAATGSGFVISKDGLILTNDHVVAAASKVTVGLGDHPPRTAKVVGTDPSNDLALLRIDPKGLDLRPLKLGDSSSAQVGNPVIAIGNPFGLDRTLTEGVVSALQRQLRAPNGFAIDHVLQTDAAINPGNSGGPLLDAHGRVIGINSQIATGGQGSRGNVGIGFAVPINAAKRELDQLKAGRVRHAYLGVVGASSTSSGGASSTGARIARVTPGTPAAHAELRPGDVITAIDGRSIHNFDDVIAIVDAKQPGDHISLRVRRGGHQRTVSLTLGDRPAHPAASARG